MTGPTAIPFSVLTPTYNRAHTLPRTFASLVAQTLLPHEWILVDDGSTDETRPLVEEWAARAPFPIRYVYQENAGKPAAHNAGVAVATGEMLVVVDADDWCVPTALERLQALWLEIPAAERDSFTGVTVNCMVGSGEMIGAPFPHSPMDSTMEEMHVRGWLKGEKWGCHRVDVLRAFPFPRYPGERYVAEGLVWNRIGRQYRMRFVNEALQYKEFLPGGITRTWLRTAATSPRGMRDYYLELACHTTSAAARAFALANVSRFGWHAGMPVLTRSLLHRFPLLAPPAACVGTCMWLWDAVRLRSAAQVHRTSNNEEGP